MVGSAPEFRGPPIGQAVKDAGLRGVHARSAAIDDGTTLELAWFPARESSMATLEERLPFGEWWQRSAETSDLG